MRRESFFLDKWKTLFHIPDCNRIFTMRLQIYPIKRRTKPCQSPKREETAFAYKPISGERTTAFFPAQNRWLGPFIGLLEVMQRNLFSKVQCDLCRSAMAFSSLFGKRTRQIRRATLSNDGSQWNQIIADKQDRRWKLRTVYVDDISYASGEL